MTSPTPSPEVTQARHQPGARAPSAIDGQPGRTVTPGRADLAPAHRSALDTPADKRKRRARTVLAAAMAAIAVFVALNIVVQLLPPHYSMVSQAVSDLAAGPYGWAMDIAFALGGASILAFVAGAFMATTPKTRPLAGFLLLGVWGAATEAIAFVHPDVVDANGYPGTLKAFALSASIHGKAHLAIAAVVFVTMVLGLVTSSRHLGREPRLRASQRTARLIAAAALADLLLTDELGRHGTYGLMERGVSLLGFAWLIVVARRLRQDSTKGADNMRTDAASRGRPSPRPGRGGDSEGGGEQQQPAALVSDPDAERVSEQAAGEQIAGVSSPGSERSPGGVARAHASERCANAAVHTFGGAPDFQRRT